MKKIYDLRDKSIFVAGHNGMVGSSVVNELKSITKRILTVDKKKLDLTNEKEVHSWFEKNLPQVVIIAAAKVGGIHANNIFPVDFLEKNLRIQNNLIKNSCDFGVEKLLFLGSSCIYPKESKQPIKESYLLTGTLEPTNQWYAIAKLAGIRLCQAYRKQYNCDYITLIPTNLYGPNDNFHPEFSHVPAALIRRFHEAKINKLDVVNVWGTGKPKREFLHVNDLAKAVIYMLENYSSAEPINIGTGLDITIKNFSKLVAEIIQFKGKIFYDHTKPDGTILKRLDVSKAFSLGWSPKMEINYGLRETYNWALKNVLDQ